MKTRGRGRPPTPFLFKYLRRYYTDLILISLIVVFSVMSGFYFGSAFGFNMTEELNNETRLLQACMTFNLDIKDCDMIYGGIQ